MWKWFWVGAAMIVATVNIVTMRRLWTSILFERSQKVAQTILLWLVPGSFIVVRQALGPHRRLRSIDSTADGPDTASVDSTDVANSHHVSDAVAGGDFDGGGGGD